MKKDAIIDLIVSDLNEMKTLIETFREPERIAAAFIDLLEQKNASIGREVKLLNYWATERSLNLNEGFTELGAVVDVNAPLDTTPKVESSKEPITKPETTPQTKEAKEDVEAIHVNAEPERVETQEQRVEEKKTTTATAQVVVKPVVKPIEKPVEKPMPKPAERQASKPSAVSRTTSETSNSSHASAADITNYGTPVADINKAIGVNDRFLYLRELFAGDKLAMDQTIRAVNEATNFEQAYQYIKMNFRWDESQPVTEAFLKAVHRRFL
jgi:hypothetical protein